MDSKITTALSLVLTVMFSGCASQTGTESDFGDSVRANIAAQTMHPSPELDVVESGDGKRLESVVRRYREKVGDRQSVSDTVNLGVPTAGQR